MILDPIFSLCLCVLVGRNKLFVIRVNIYSYFSFVQDEICRSVADNGGIDAILCCIDDCGEQGNKTVARTCLSLLSKVLNWCL